MTRATKTDIATPLITVNHVSQKVALSERSVEILKDTSFTIDDGSFTVIYGPSGSGKTTLLNTITGLAKPSSGSVEYLGRDIYDLTEADLAHFRARTMGIVYQSNYWVRSLNVLENVALPLFFLGYNKENAEREALESLRRVGMAEHRDTLPALLSGGEQQRASMARALVSNPSYIVADEPTGNLDSKNGDAIIELLNYFHTELQRTVILVTHNSNYLKYGTQLLSLKDGEVVESSQKNTRGHTQTKKVTSQSHVTHAFSASLEKLHPIRLPLLLHMAIANVRTKRLRSSLTTLGMSIGVSAIFLLLSFGLGLQNLVQEQIVGTDSVRVIDVTSANSEILTLNEQSIERIQQVPDVEKIGKQNTSAGEFKLGSASADTIIYGVDKSFLELSNITLAAGKLLSVTSSREVMITESLLKTLGYKDSSQVIGEELLLTLKLDDRDYSPKESFKIVGVMSAGDGAILYVPQSVYAEAEVTQFEQIKIVTASPESVPQVRQQLENFGYQTSSPLDTLEQVNRFFQFFNIILVSFGAAGMFIAVIGIFNTLTIALLERIREIGLMVALGARRRDVRRLFVAESLILSLTGAVAGIVLAILSGLVINASLNHLSATRGVNEEFSLFSTPPWMILAALLSAAVIGYVVAYLPAQRASRIKPMDALRRE